MEYTYTKHDLSHYQPLFTTINHIFVEAPICCGKDHMGQTGQTISRTGIFLWFHSPVVVTHSCLRFARQVVEWTKAHSEVWAQAGTMELTSLSSG